MKLELCFPGGLLLLAALLLPLGTAARADTYRMNLNLSTERGTLEGQVFLAYLNNSQQALGEIRCRLDINLSFPDSMEILAVKAASGEELTWEYLPFSFAKLSSEKGQVGIRLPRPLGVGETVELEISCRLRGKQFLGSAMTILQDDPYHSFDAWYPKAMTRSSDGWSINDDRLADYDVTIEVPADLLAASTGKVLEERDAGGGRQSRRLRAEGVRGFTFYGSAFVKRHVRQSEGVEIALFISDVSAKWVEPLLDAAADSLSFYYREYGDYPVDHLDIVCPIVAGGHGSFACFNIAGIFVGGRFEEQFRWLVAHEVAHQYFGNSVGQHREGIGWVPIGLGMVMDQHYLRDRGLDASFGRMVVDRFYFYAIKNGYDTSLTQPAQKLMSAERPWSFAWNLALMHGKAYAVCSMLRDYIGAEEFQGMMKKIYAERSGTLFGHEDLIRYCEAETGEPLDWFVADWIESNAVLDYAVAAVRKTENGWEVEIKRMREGSFPVVVEAETASGEKIRLRADRQMEVSILRFDTGEELKSVVIDPDGVYPDFDATNNRWPATEEPADKTAEKTGS